MTNWFADKLGAAAPQQAPSQTYYPPMPPQHPAYYTPPPQYQPPQNWQGAPQQAPQFHGTVQQYIQASGGSGTLRDALVAGAMRGPTAELQQHSATCPTCGDTMFDLNRNGGTIMNRDGMSVAPPPRCMSCGYNPKYVQLGQTATNSGTVLHV